MDEIEYLGATSTIQSYNLFTYCEGNPVNMVDESGAWPKWISILTDAILDAAVDVILTTIVGKFTKVTVDIASVILKDAHYDRLEHNEEYEFPESYDEVLESKEYITGVKANCHQFSADVYGDNIKILSSDGKYEAIYNSKTGKQVKDPRDVGTYNYYHPTEQVFGHAVVDVVPWILWGNSKDDNTCVLERITSLVGIR